MKFTRVLFCAALPYVLVLPLVQGAQSTIGQVYNFSTLAGTVGSTGSNNATGTSATFDLPTGVAVDSSGNVFVADTTNNLIREITMGGVVSTFAGSGAAGHFDAMGTSATFAEPKGVAVDSNGNVFVADTFNDTIRRIDTSGNVTTYAGLALTPGTTNSNTVATLARFKNPAAVAVDSSGNVYVADTGNNLIRKIAPGSGATVGGVVTTIADSSALLDAPSGIAVDSTSGNVYIADTDNSVIKVISSGVVSVLAGEAGSPGTTNGTGTAAQFFFPVGIALGSGGILYVCDTGNVTIRRVTEAGVVTTIGGAAGTSTPFSNGTDSYATFNAPEGIAVEGDTVFVADAENQVIREGITLTISGDLTGDNMPDIFWTNTSTGQRGAYLMNGTSVTGWAGFGPVASEWRIAAVADFLGNGSNDILWQDTSTGECGFWMMDGLTVTGWVELGVVPTQWRIAAVGNFHGTGSNDILWQNMSTGVCGFYIMSGTTVTGWVPLGTAPANWEIVAAADVNGDGKPDILWFNSVTLDSGFYIMNGTAVTGWAELGSSPAGWTIAAVADFNSDGNPDILWQNRSTGDAGFYIMNGTTVTGWTELGVTSTAWQIQPE
jgi:VCBS repeat protein/NHL repeat-containing protein